MKKQQLILSGAGLCLLSILLIFGKTSIKKDIVTNPSPKAATGFSIAEYVNSAKQKLPVYQADYLNRLENNILDLKQEQQITNYNSLASFWEDSVHNHDLYIFYTSESSKLVNSEKNLTFAARLMLTSLKNEHNRALRGWKAEQAIELFDKAIEQNPTNDSLKVGKGSCYVFGKGMTGDAQETMKGIQELLQVVKKDSTNMQAQLVLGIGGVISTQYDKAIVRLQTVVNQEPDNAEAVSWLADAYASKGDNENAIKWYRLSKRLVNDPQYSKEVDDRIKMLK
ncbi:MAG: tetratricopeptide repeat protein [Bacteroidota bacterium]